MSTNTPISTINLSSAASSITFSSIPQTYTDLILIASVKSVTAPAGIKYRLNGDSGSNYSHNTLTATGSAISSQKESLTSGLLAYYGYTDTVNYGLYQHNFMNYAKTDYYKASIGRADNTSGAGVALMTNTWRNSSAITSISVFLDSGNMASGSTFNLYGIVAASGYATGGNLITTDGSYWYHTFTSSGTFTPTRALTVDYLVVAGGGAGGSGAGGGGGAGGMRCTVDGTGGSGSLETALSLTLNTNYTVTVGAGGAGNAGTMGNSGTNGANGVNSVFSTITSTGGGGGGGATTGQNGGSGGGGLAAPDIYYAGGSASPAGQGFAGGSGLIFGASNAGGGGGGGASAVGGNAAAFEQPGNGGAGRATSISGSSVTYAGGGGGGAYPNTDNVGAGGSSIGGAGGKENVQVGQPGNTNTGSGGGGGAASNTYSNASGNGGSGIVIVRYAV